MSSFPEGWFLIKNHNNGYVLSIEKSAVGEPVVISSIRKDLDSQLWQYGEDSRLHNKKTGFVLDITKGVAKVGSNLVLQNDTKSADGQTFGITSDGLIHIVKNPNLVLGIKDSFFSRSEGQHVHLQLIDKNHKDRKEQRWELVVPSKRHSLGSVLSGSVSSLKRTISGASLGSTSSLHIQHNEEDSYLDESAHVKSDHFPEGEFFIKSELTGHFVSIDASSLNGSGSKLCLEPLRPTNYDSQLWQFDQVTHRLINKGSGLAISAEELADEAFVSQSSSLTEQDLSSQAWSLGASGTLRLKSNPQFLLGFKKDNWFNLKSEVANVLLQKADQRVHSYQKFVLALPIFKKKTTEIVSATAQIGVFPEGYFFIKNQKHGLVVSVLETEKLAAHILASPLDSQNYNRQLWTHKDGFLINKASQFVLDVRGGCIVNGSELCQYKQKKVGYENQQWGLTVEGFIHAKTHEGMVLALDKNIGEKPTLALAHKKTPDHEEQRWNFVLPVFKHKSASVTEKTVQKSIVYHRFAQYPSGWFFIRSFEGTKDKPLVLTASGTDDSLTLTEISHTEWRHQLWMHQNGGLINFASQLSLDVKNIAVNTVVYQEIRHATESQRWVLTTEGVLIHASNAALSLVPESTESGYKLKLAEQQTIEHRWGLLSPETKVENSLQVLSSWKSVLLTECKKIQGKYVQKIVHRLADWPQETFYISAQEGYALVPERLESYATVTVKKLEFGHYEQFRWTYRDGYLVHVATGLVLHASDELIGGSELQIRERLVSENRIDERQRWVLKTDGSIVAETKTSLGFALLKQEKEFRVQLAYVSKTSEHYTWGLVNGHYETRYSNVYKKDMTVLTRLERILLTVRQSQVISEKTKLVTRSYGLFPENWFYIRSKADSSLVLTSPDKKQGSKLTLSKMDYKLFRRQLWHVEDEDCLINLETGYVIDIAGGALDAGSEAIQWHQKFLKIQRKNQSWALSVDVHIHPKSHSGVVLGPKGNSASDGAEIQLHTRGSLDLEYQRWTFAIPIFGRPGGVTSVGILDGNHSDVFVDSLHEKELTTTSTERYERAEQITLVHRWGIFPQDGFFIRSHDSQLSLTVERKPRIRDDQDEYEVTLRPIDYKAYRWHFWTYEDGHLINKQTGLALDASPIKGVLLEDGLQSSLYVRAKTMSSYQFWALTAQGEVHLKSDQRLVVGVSSESRVSVTGAQVGLRQLRIHKFVNEKGQQEATLKSQSWLQWSFSKPVFGARKITEEVTSVVSTVTGGLLASDDQEVESLTEEIVEVKESEESSEDYAPEVDSDDESDSDSEDDDEEVATQVEDNAVDKLNLVGNLGIATAGAAILAGAAATTDSPTKTNVAQKAPVKVAPVAHKAPVKVAPGVTIGAVDNKQQDVLTSEVTKKKAPVSREDSFHLSYDYVPTGYEKVVRYISHNSDYFPHEGYFMIKSYLHGHVLDVANNEARDGSYIVLSPIKTTNYASQLWSYRGGRLVNLKSHNLVLDSSLNDTVVSGERVGLSTQKTAVGISDQHWEFDIESGVVHLAGKRNLILTVKELTPGANNRIDLFIQEEKSHQKSKFARAEQRWEIKIPALVPVEQAKNNRLESNYTIIEAGKVTSISSTLSAVLAFEWLKSTFYHKMSQDNQWPSTENFFFVRIGNENAYLCSGESVSGEVTFASIERKQDHKRFLWAFVDGYLVNYKYMLRIVFDKNSKKFSLSSDTDTLNQVFSITSQGSLSLQIDSEVIYFDTQVIEGKKTTYQLVTSQEQVTSSKYPVQLHIPVFSNHQIEKEANVALSTITTWIYSSQKSTTQTIKNYRYGVFPASTWFFIKADTKSDDSLVLSAQSTNLVLKKLSFEDYKNQLWTFRDDALVNYGSKLVIDVSGGAIDTNSLLLSSESGLGTQKWSLTAEGSIYLDSYAGRFAIGSQTIEENAKTILVQKDQTKVIHWKFSVPVFGKKPTQANETMNTVIEKSSSSVEEGVMIETVKSVEFKVEEVFAKKIKPSKSNKNTKKHDVHDILTNVGIVTGAVAAGAAVVAGTSKVIDKLAEKKHDKKVEKNKKDDTTKIVVRRSSKTSAQVVQESQTIVRAWKIVFIRRIHRATTKQELVQVIEESREDLFRRLDEHLRVYTSVEHVVSGSVPEWHVSIEQVKELYRARVFERFLDRLDHEDIKSASELDFDTVLHSATEEVDRHYASVITEQQSKTEVVSENKTESHDHILLAVDTIKVRVRHWFVGLYETISVAKQNGSSDEEVKSLIDHARQQLTNELTELKTTTISHVEQSSTLAIKTALITQTLEKAITQTETVVSKQVEVIATKKYQVTETDWLEVTRTSEESLSSDLKVYQTAITQEVTQVQEKHADKSDQTEIAVVLDEKMVSVAQETVTSKLLETKTKLTSWFSQVNEQISWVLESSESHREDTLAIVDAAQIELSARIEETKLVLRTYYAHLTYLSWAERRRIEYALDNVKSSLVANIAHFKQSVEKQDSKEQVLRLSQYSFGATVSRVVLLDIQTIITRVSQVKETKQVVNTTEAKTAEVNKVAAITESVHSVEKNSKPSSIQSGKSSQGSHKEEVKAKAEQVQAKVEQKVDAVGQGSKTEQAKTEQSKVTKVDEEESHKSKATLAAVGAAAAAAIASAAIYHHHEGKKDSEIKDKPAVTHVSSGSDKVEKTQKTTSHQEKSDSLVVVYDELNVTVQEWVVKLNQRVIEGAQKKASKEEIETIVSESQQELVVAIEKAKRKTTSTIGTSQTSFHETLGWIRTTIWTQTAEVKRIALEATTSQVEISVLEEKLSAVKESTLTKITGAIEKSKKSATQLVSSDVKIAAGKKFEGKDYSQKSHGQQVEKTKVTVGVLIEETRTTVQRTLTELAHSISERRKQGGDHLQADIEAIVQKTRQDVKEYVQHAKTQFEKHDDKETNQKVQVTLDQIQQTVLVQVSKVEEISTIQVSEVEYTEKITSACQEAYKHVDAALTVSETIIGHHVEVVAESTEAEKHVENVSLGVEYGLVVVSETTRSVSKQLSQLIERVHHQVTAKKDTLEQDVQVTITETNVEIDRVLDEAKTKIEYELSMVSSQEKVQEEHFVAEIEELRVSTKKRVSQVHQVAVSHQETVSEKLLQIAEESRHEVSSRLDRFKSFVTEKVHKDSSVVEKPVEKPVAKPAQKPVEEDHDHLKKVLVGSAAVAAGTAIAVEVAKKVSEHKQKVQEEEKRKKETLVAVQEVKVQFNQWLTKLTETVTKQSKESVSQEEISVTIETSKKQFLEVIQKTKTSQTDQQEALTWVEQTTIAQATRIQEIVTSSHKSSVIDVGSRLEVLKISTTQEVEKALDKIKSGVKFIGSTVDQLKQKEAALLDVKSELSLVVHDARTSIVTFFETFTQSVVTRVQQGGENVSKDVAILVADARKQVTVHVESVKNKATTKLSTLETKSTVVSVAALSGIATAELISVLKKTEETLLERIDRVHSTVWYIQKDQDVTQVVESITKIQTETVTEVSQQIEESHYGFATGVAVAHQSTHLVEKVHHSETALKASLSIQEVKVTIREWLRQLTQKVSEGSQKNQSSEEIDVLITEEKKRLFDYLDVSATQISEHLKSEEKTQDLSLVVEKIKTSVTQSTTEIKKISVESSGQSNGGYDQMSVVTNRHEHAISETLVVYETKTIKKEEVKPKPTENKKDKKETQTVVAVEYLTLTIHQWLEQLMIEVSEISQREHDLNKVTEQITQVVNDAKDYITIELDTVSHKVNKQQDLVNLIEWTRGMVLQSTAQIQQVGVNSAVSFTLALDQMRPLVSATETQIKVALERSNKTIKIDVERKSTHAEKHEIKKETRKQERVKADAEKKAKAEKKKVEREKKAEAEKAKIEKKKAKVEKKTQEKQKKAELKKKIEEKKDEEKKTQKPLVDSDSDYSSDSDSSDSDASDSEVQLKKAQKDIQKIVAAGAVLSVSVIVREWYEQLIDDVSSRAKIGGSHSDSDIETIVKKATLSIHEKLRLLSEHAHKSLVDTTTVQQYRQSIEWAKNQVTQSSLQIQSIGITSAISATSKTGGIEQMRPIAVSIQQQIDVETQRYKLVEQKKSAVTKVEAKPAVTKVEHKKNTQKVSEGKTAIEARKNQVDKLQEHVTEVISESKTVVIAWYSQVIRQVSIRVHQGGNNVKEDVTAIIEKSKAELNETLKRTHKKLSIEQHEDDQSYTVIQGKIQESLEQVQKTAELKITQVQEITVNYRSESEVTEKLSGLLESSKTEVTESFDNTHKQVVQVIEEETVQHASTVVIIETVDHVKSTVTLWQQKVSDEIQRISVDQTIENKEERIKQVIEEAKTEVERVTQEAKTKVAESCQSVKKVSQSKQKELLTNIDYAQETFKADVQKVQEVSIESVHKSETNVKESIGSVFESSRNKIDSFLTRTTAIVVGTATAAIAVHAIKKKEHEDEKVEKKLEKAEKKAEKKAGKEDNLSLSARENIKAITQWFELFTQRVSSSVQKKEGDVVQTITIASEQAEHEIKEIISAARGDFIKRLSHENLDQETYEFAVKHYEESLESVRVSILTEVTEVKKISIESHKTGKTQVLDVELQKLVVESSERIKVAMGSSVSITHKAQAESSALHIDVEEDQEVISDEQVEVERKEESVQVAIEEKAKKEKQSSSNLEKIVAGSLAVGGAAAGAAALIHKKKTEKTEKYESGVAAIEVVHDTVSEWFKTLVQKVSVASKSGASSEQITVIVQESRVELDQFIQHVKTAGAAHCTSAADEQQFVSKIEWVSSVAYAQATQIQQIGINASTSKSDLTSQMDSLATASFHQIQVTLEQMKTNISFHQKINKISSNKQQKVAKPIEKPVTAVDKTKVAYGVIQETRVATVALFVSLTESIVTRIRQGGAHVEEDIHKIVETAEKEVTQIFEKSKKTSVEVDEKTRAELEVALTKVHKTVEEEIGQVKKVTVKAVGSSKTTADVTVEKVLQVSKESKEKVEGGFVSVSETITASLIVVNQTAQKATKTVQSWYTDLTEKINHLLEASDCSEEETQTKINKVVADAEVEIKTKIQQETSEKKSTNDHHLDVFYGNIQSSVEKQLNDVKVAVQDKSKINKITLNQVLKTSETKLKQEVDTHYEAVQQITDVKHITGTEQQVATQVENNRHGIYKDTIEKVAVGTAAVAAAAAVAIGFHKKNQKTENKTVQVVEETSIQEVRAKVDNWFTLLTERVVTRTKQGGQNVSADVTEIVKSAQEELQVIIHQVKSEQKDNESTHTFTHTLEWIQITAVTQSTQITEIVNHSSTSSIDLVTQIENHVSVTKQQINTAFETHKFTTAAVEKQENVVQIVTETREQAQKRISLETTVIVQERKTEITNYLVLLMESITTIIHSHSESIRADIFTRLELAEKEIETYIQDTKQRFLSITSTSVVHQTDVETQKLASNSLKQSLDCIENIRATLIIQISVVRETFSRIEVEDIDVITERLHAIIDRAQQRVHHTFDAGIELAISSAFEGKVVTWTETAKVPQSFKKVSTIAYDLASVIDYRKSLHQVWKRIVAPKNDIVLSTMDFTAFANDWYGAFIEIKQENKSSDDVVLHEALVHILKRFYVLDSFSQAETQELCESWKQVGTHEDASIGIRRIKNQKYATIAVSDSFSTRTMVDLAQKNCFCWHAQFSYDMFTAEQHKASESLIQGTIRLLGLANASELAIVTANSQLVSAAKQQGCHAVLVERQETKTTTDYDIKVDGLDVFGESVQSFLEHESMVKVWDDKEAPSAPIVWAQKVKNLIN